MNDKYASPFAVALKEAGVMNSYQPKNINRFVPNYGSYGNIKSIDHTKKDSIDFINISNDSKTYLGKILSMDYVDAYGVDKNKKKINYFAHPIFGKFNSIYNFSVYLRSKTGDHSIRYFLPKQLGNYIRENSDDLKTEVPNELALIAYACWERINQNYKYKKALAESSLPFDSYRVVVSDIIISGRETKITKHLHTARSSFIIMVANTIRDHLKLNIENIDDDFMPSPSFEFLRDYKEGDIYAPYAIISPTEDTYQEEEEIDGNLDSMLDDNIGNILHTEPDTGEAYDETDVDKAIDDVQFDEHWHKLNQ